MSKPTELRAVPDDGFSPPNHFDTQELRTLSGDSATPTNNYPALKAFVDHLREAAGTLIGRIGPGHFHVGTPECWSSAGGCCEPERWHGMGSNRLSGAPAASGRTARLSVGACSRAAPSLRWPPQDGQPA